MNIFRELMNIQLNFFSPEKFILIIKKPIDKLVLWFWTFCLDLLTDTKSIENLYRKFAIIIYSFHLNFVSLFVLFAFCLIALLSLFVCDTQRIDRNRNSYSNCKMEKKMEKKILFCAEFQSRSFRTIKIVEFKWKIEKKKNKSEFH